jgi:hypothetical protein
MRSSGWGGESDGLPELTLFERARGIAWYAAIHAGSCHE